MWMAGFALQLICLRGRSPWYWVGPGAGLNVLKKRKIYCLWQGSNVDYCVIYPTACRSQWPRGLRRRSAAARLLRSWFRIPPGAWMFVCYECCVLSGRGLCDELIARPEESYRLWSVVVCDLETSRTWRPWPALGRSATKKDILQPCLCTIWAVPASCHCINEVKLPVIVTAGNFRWMGTWEIRGSDGSLYTDCDLLVCYLT